MTATSTVRAGSPPAPSREAAAAYAARLAERQRASGRLTRRHVQLGNAKLAGLGVLAAWLWAAFVGHSLPPLSVVWPALGLAALAIWHDRVLQQLDRAERAVRFYEDALGRLGDHWAGTGETGDRFLDTDHPYAADLDLFGRGSLFELLSTARTRSGEDALARWLLAPAAPDEIRERHRAIDELRARLDLREALAVSGTTAGAGVPAERLRAWGDAPAIVTRRAPAVLAAALGAFAFAALVCWALGWWSGVPLGLAVVLDAGYRLAFRRQIAQVVKGSDAAVHDLALLSAVLSSVEREAFTSPRLIAIRSALHAGGEPPSRRILRLQRLTDLLNSRRNQIFAPLAELVLWTPQVAFAIERWRQAWGPRLGEWLDRLGEFEALCSLAAYAYGRPGDPFPEIAAGDALFEGDDLSHPLIPASRAVGNSVRLGAAHRMLLVSGSNMSGKSTLLRTVGVNTVLALSGAPVRASRLRLSPLMPGATLRVQDSLIAGQSRFYAEITRLRTIVSLTTGPLPVLFLLDELLSGTNSHDREQGGAAILTGLLDRGAIGLVTTHDLALASVADALAPRAANVHFADTLENGALVFDYRMRPGVVRTSNALALMRAVGLEV